MTKIDFLYVYKTDDMMVATLYRLGKPRDYTPTPNSLLRLAKAVSHDRHFYVFPWAGNPGTVGWTADRRGNP